MIVAVSPNRFGKGIEVCARVAQHRIDAHAEFAVVGHRHVDLGLGHVDAGVVNARNAEREHFRHRLAVSGSNLVLGGLRHMSVDEVHGLVDEHPGRIAVRIAQDLAPHRVGCVIVDTGNLQRPGVGPAGVAVDPAHPDRTITDDGVDVGGRRECLDRPEYLVPAAAEQPALTAVVLCVCGDLGNSGIQTGCAGEVQARLEETEPIDVRMRVGQSGEQRPAVAIYTEGLRVLIE